MALGREAGAEAVDGEAALFLSLDEADVAKDAQMVRRDDDFDSQRIGDFADVARTLPQGFHDPQPEWFRERFEKLGAVFRLVDVFGLVVRHAAVRAEK